MTFTPKSLRDCAGALELFQQGKRELVEEFNETTGRNPGKWVPLEGTMAICNGWLYRPKPEPKTLPWSKRADVPLNCWLRPKHADVFCGIVVGFYSTGLRFVSSGVEEVDYSKLSSFEHSTDRVNWSPCTITAY